MAIERSRRITYIVVFSSCPRPIFGGWSGRSVSLCSDPFLLPEKWSFLSKNNNNNRFYKQSCIILFQTHKWVLKSHRPLIPTKSQGIWGYLENLEYWV